VEVKSTKESVFNELMRKVLELSDENCKLLIEYIKNELHKK
jgi:hypothetical protein